MAIRMKHGKPSTILLLVRQPSHQLIGPKLANDIPLSNNNDHCHREYVKGINNRFEFRPTDSGQVLIKATE